MAGPEVTPGLKPSCDSETGTELILLKGTDHSGAGVPITQETHRKFIFKNVLMPLTHMSVSGGMWKNDILP